MYSLDYVLEHCDKESLIKGTLAYTGNIPYSGDDINMNHHNHHVMKCYEGLMSVEEFEKNKSDTPTDIEQLYSKYIFQTGDVLNGDFVICDHDIDNLIYIRMIASQESGHLERLDKLMLRIYFEKAKEELIGVVCYIYEKYDWAKQYIWAQKENEFSRIFQDGTDEYNANFGMREESDEKPSSEKTKGAKAEEPSAEKDWILQKYGGEYYGETAGMVY